MSCQVLMAVSGRCGWWDECEYTRVVVVVAHGGLLLGAWSHACHGSTSDCCRGAPK